MIHTNPNISSLKPSATLAINQKVLELRKKGQKVFHFGFGQSPFPIHKSIVRELKQHANNNNYLPSVGLPELKDTISQFLKKYLNAKYNTEYIYIGPGSKELLYQTILLLEGTFLVPQGSWVSYLPQIKSRGGNYAILDTFIKDNYKLSAKTLNDFCAQNPKGQKCLILNSPNNPTGAVYTNKELMELAKVCKANEIIVLADEIYALINFYDKQPPSMAQHYSEGTISFGGLSKIFSAGGYRMGYMALPEKLYALHGMYRSLFSETFSAVASPVQYAAMEAFTMKQEIKEYIKTNTDILKTIGEYVYRQLKAIGVLCTEPQGGFYLMVDFERFREGFVRKNLLTSNAIGNYLIDNEHIALLPGSDFYFDGKKLIFRLAFVDFDGTKAINGFPKYKDDPTGFIKEYCPNIYEGIERLKGILTTL